MNDTNSVAIVGRLTRDAELKYTASGMAVSEFSIAVNRSVKNGDKWETIADFFDVTLWGKQAESVVKFLTKGSKSPSSASYARTAGPRTAKTARK